MHFWSRKPQHVRSDGQDVFIVSLIQSGDGELTQFGRSARLVAGDLAIYDCGAPFDYTLRAKTQLIKIPRQILESKLDRPRDFLAVNIDRSNPLIPVLGDLLTRALTIELSGRPRLAGREETLERDRRDRRVDLRSAQGRFPEAQSPRALEKVKRFIGANLDSHDLTPETLAAAGAVSVRTLNRLFGAMGTTPMRWVWSERLEASRAALVQGQVRSVTKAALRSRVQRSRPFQPQLQEDLRTVSPNAC